MSCLQAIEGEDTKNPFICLIMNLFGSLSDKGPMLISAVYQATVALSEMNEWTNQQKRPSTKI